MVGTVVGRILDDSSFSKWEWTGVDLVTDIVVVGNKITFRNASFRLPNSFPTNYTTLPISFTFFDQCRRPFLPLACLFAYGVNFIYSN